MNDFGYFTEIEQHFQRRRGSILLLSTLDWALMETWFEAGVPLPVVLRGIDEAFDRYEQRALRAKSGTRRLRRVNGLAWAAQAVMLAAETAAEAALGSAPAGPPVDTGLEKDRIAQWLEANAQLVEAAGGDPATSQRLRELAADLAASTTFSAEDLDRTLTVLDEKQYAALLASTPEAELLALRAEAAAELAASRSRLKAEQFRQIERQFLQKRLLALRGLPRLSLFYLRMQ